MVCPITSLERTAATTMVARRVPLWTRHRAAPSLVAHFALLERVYTELATKVPA
jgi:hypothetical protein